MHTDFDRFRLQFMHKYFAPPAPFFVKKPPKKSPPLNGSRIAPKEPPQPFPRPLSLQAVYGQIRAFCGHISELPAVGKGCPPPRSPQMNHSRQQAGGLTQKIPQAPNTSRQGRTFFPSSENRLPIPSAVLLSVPACASSRPLCIAPRIPRPSALPVLR